MKTARIITFVALLIAAVPVSAETGTRGVFWTPATLKPLLLIPAAILLYYVYERLAKRKD